MNLPLALTSVEIPGRQHSAHGNHDGAQGFLVEALRQLAAVIYGVTLDFIYWGQTRLMLNRATVVDAENYLFKCMRYIELNPVHAGMVRHPRDYHWSSYRTNAEGKADASVEPHGLYRSLAKEEGERRFAYRELVKTPLDAELPGEIRECSN